MCNLEKKVPHKKRPKPVRSTKICRVDRLDGLVLTRQGLFGLNILVLVWEVPWRLSIKGREYRQLTHLVRRTLRPIRSSQQPVFTSNTWYAVGDRSFLGVSGLLLALILCRVFFLKISEPPGIGSSSYLSAPSDRGEGLENEPDPLPLRDIDVVREPRPCALCPTQAATTACCETRGFSSK